MSSNHRLRFSYDGKLYSVYGRTLSEVYEKKARKLIELKLGSPSNMTLADWTAKCLPLYKVGVTEGSYKTIESRIKREILWHIGSRPIKTITPEMCQYVLNEQKGRSRSYIDKVAGDLKFLFRHAVGNGLIQKDPTSLLVKPRGTYSPRRALSPEERKTAESVIASDPRYLLFGLMLYCGCRPSEAAECKGSDISLMDDVFLLHIRGTKTALSDRFVPVPDILFQQIKNTPKTAYIARNRNGKPYTEKTRPNLWKSFWRECNRKAGCKTYRNQLLPPYPFPEDLTAYCLRHEYCTNLARLGVDIRTAQKLMGHSTITMTADIYTHVENDALKAAAKLLEVATSVATEPRNR